MNFWNKDEDEKLVNLISKQGTSWKSFEKYFSTRTKDSIRNRWMRLNQHPNRNIDKEKKKKYNKCTKCGQIKRGHICGEYNFLNDRIVNKEKNNNLSEIPNTQFKELNLDFDLSSSLDSLEKDMNANSNEYLDLQKLDTNKEDLFIDSFNIPDDDNIKLNNISELLPSDNNFHKTLPPLGICTDLKRLGVIIDISKENIFEINNNQIINAIPRVEINNTNLKLRNKRVKIFGEEYLSKVYENTHYPSQKDKDILIKKTGLKRKQIENWFHNKRRRNKVKIDKYQ